MTILNGPISSKQVVKSNKMVGLKLIHGYLYGRGKETRRTNREALIFLYYANNGSALNVASTINWI